MHVQNYSYPWQYYVIDDFLEPQHFELIQSLSSRWQKPRTQEEKFNLFLSDFKFYEETFSFKEEAEAVEDILMKAMYELKIEFKLDGTFRDFHIEYVNCGNNFYYPVHKDALVKIFSNVLYVSPEGDGTRLYESKKGEVVKSVDWKPNRLVSFKPADNTWHDYYSSKENRITFNLCFANWKSRHNRSKPHKRVETDLTPL